MVFETFRNYTDSNNQNNIEDTYKLMYTNQTSYYVKNCINNYSIVRNMYNVWDIIDKLNNIYDESDPDNDLPQIYHAYQTAESIRNNYFDKNGNFKDNNYITDLFSKEEWNNLPDIYKRQYNTDLKTFYSDVFYWEWFILVGFIHDFGKVLLLDEFGGLPQWSVVGDTFPVDYPLSNNVVFYDKNYHLNNTCLNNTCLKNTCLKNKKQENNIGFEKHLFSYGHDEYFATVLERTLNYIPKEGIYVVRFHSFYPWHTPKNNNRGYTEIASAWDWHMLPLLKAFQKADLYSKTKELPDVNDIKTKYDLLIKKYFIDYEFLL